MSRNPNHVTISDFYCTNCGKQGISIPRKADQQREAGHLKSLWCPNCRKVVNHVEVRAFGSYSYEDFKEEFELGRFVDGQRVPVADLIKCTKEDCHYNVNGRCWNSTKSFDCGHRPMGGEESNE